MIKDILIPIGSALAASLLTYVFAIGADRVDTYKVAKYIITNDDLRKTLLTYMKESGYFIDTESNSRHVTNVKMSELTGLFSSCTYPSLVIDSYPGCIVAIRDACKARNFIGGFFNELTTSATAGTYDLPAPNTEFSLTCVGKKAN